MSEDHGTALALLQMTRDAEANAKEKQSTEDALTKGLRTMLQGEAEKQPKAARPAPAPQAEPPIPDHADPWKKDDDTRAFLQFLGQP